MIFVEDWGAAYGSPYLVDSDFERDSEQTGVLAEDGDALSFHRPCDLPPEPRVAFVDGIRRAEAWLYQLDADGVSARGLAAAFAVGSAICDCLGARYENEEISRVAIWGSGQAPMLSAIGRWSWLTHAVPSSDPDAPLETLQKMMRTAEGKLAGRIAANDTLTFIDGPLDYVIERGAEVAGHVKTHHRAFLPPEVHRRIPGLALGERTSIFALEERYSCYVRIAQAGPFAGPWSGVVRLHLPGERGLGGAVRLADRATSVLPRFAGIAHRDPRAPQNLQPIGALESHLRHLMGDAALAMRAVRDAVRVERTA